ncbi:class I SAM-dependent methyltransferase [Desulfovibrio piger]|uniref:class I SAM-dependent methyltransferase n=1 Tax=Desulfovibrio piger TaxID=901 RepID=UPI0022B264B4|nr:class I SAM-dependent methyltransferase [Desulfovibrio piger]
MQEAALRASRARLEQAGLAVRCCASAAAACALPPLPSHMTDIRLVLHSHAALPELLDALSEEDRQRPLLAGIFNFGYLPGTDKRRTTTAAGSLAAVDALLERLAPQGCLSLHCYTGHEGGAAEEAALAQRLARLEPRRWRVLHCRDANRESRGESILLAERLPVRQR